MKDHLQPLNDMKETIELYIQRIEKGRTDEFRLYEALDSLALDINNLKKLIAFKNMKRGS